MQVLRIVPKSFAIIALLVASSATDAAPLVFGTIGDSISVGFNAGTLGPNPAASWASGSSPRVQSFAQRLGAVMGSQVYVHNVAETGARSQDLLTQVGKLNEVAVDFVSILIGANNVCDWHDDHRTQLAAFEFDIRTAIQRLISDHPEVKIALSPIPDMRRLYDVGLAMGCSSRWTTFDICPRLLGSDRTELDRQNFTNRLADANDVLANTAAKFPDNVVFLEEIRSYRFEAEDVSRLDCFHPGMIGQTTLAREAWKSHHSFFTALSDNE